MTTKLQTIINRVTGEKITWLETSKDTNGKYLLFDIEVKPKGFVPVRHFHPHQSESFEVYSGKLRVEVNGQTREFAAGESVTIPKAQPHQWWNASDTEPVKMKVKLEPAMNTEIFFEQFFGLCNDGKTKPDGSPEFLQIMAMNNEYEVYMAGPPLFLQKMMGAVIGNFARLFGYKKYYPQYSE